MNDYARTKQIQYEKEDADTTDHVENFLLHRGDDALIYPIYHQRLYNIKRVKTIISHLLLGTTRKKQRDRVNIGHGLSIHKKETKDSRRIDRDNVLCRRKPRRESRLDDRQSDCPDPRNDHRQNHGNARRGPSRWGTTETLTMVDAPPLHRLSRKICE